MLRDKRCLTFLPSIPLCLLLIFITAIPAVAFQPRQEPARFDHLVLPSPGTAIGTGMTDASGLAPGDPLRTGWEEFSGSHGGWRVWLDVRSGLPSLAIGRGIPWVAATADGAMETSTDELGILARRFIADHVALLGSWEGQLELDREASGRIADHLWQVTLRQVIGGVKVDGARFDFHVSRGRLVAFGAEHWGAVRANTSPRLTTAEARTALDAYLGVTGPGDVMEVRPASLLLVPVDPHGARAQPWQGPRGAGYTHILVYRFVLAIPGEPPTWVAEVDADAGSVVAFYDDTRYGQIVGGVYPVSDDQICPTGCEQTGWPMPFADYTEASGPVHYTGDQGLYGCATPGSTVRTTLQGPYIRVQDVCGAISETTTCDNALDLRYGPGTDCAVPSGSSPGNTHSSRSSFYHLNRAMEKGRAWLPDNNWLKSQVTDNVNINSTCNAYWDGSVNFYKSGGGCRNTGEIAGVFVHEWGHGIDQNDGGGYDDPSEGYADIVAFLETRESCVGRGFFMSSNCSGYGDACLSCTGIRDQDWDMHARHEPASPGGFMVSNCSGGGGPCGKEEHCESYLIGETVWDLAVRDLPAAGMDAASAWQLTEKLFYLSRKGSGGSAYSCTPPTGNSCGTSSWFHKFRLLDDDDANLSNGTPHAAAIFAAFHRHGIPCGLSTDLSNQSSGSCPSLAKPDLTAIEGSGDVQLAWSAVPGAASYRILRNDIGCDRAQIIIGTVAAPETVYYDDAVSPDVTLYYRIQAVGANAACESAVSDCASTAGQSPAGAVRFDQSAFGCTDVIGLKVVDGNTTSSTVTVDIASDTETVPEAVTLTELLPGAHVFAGSLPASPGPAVPGNGQLAVSAEDSVTATYNDADNGLGQPRIAYSSTRIDCSPPDLNPVLVTSITDASAVVSWTTSKPATGSVEWGPTSALGSTVSSPALSTNHALTLQPLSECGHFFFRVSSTDAYGNTAIRDAGGAPFEFNAATIPGVILLDEFESNSGWTLEGEWQIGAPTGKGTSPGDPTQAFKGAGVLGHDLTGLGAHPGDYEVQQTQRALSPVINASSLVQGQLKFRRWLNAGGGKASVRAYSGGVWTEIWSNWSVGPITEAVWSLETLDISSYADGNSQFRISFEQIGGNDPANVRAGWNVDHLMIKRGDLPDFGACGGCAGAPTFGGVLAADDANACANNGLRVSWAAAPAWGTGGSGTYSVYRSTQPGFTPSDANRVATGVAGTSWLDMTAPNDVPLYYIVRAENNETCSTGPANHGVTDANSVQASVTGTTARPLPGAVTTLQASIMNTATIHLTWTPPSGAASYNTYRSTAPSGGWQAIGSTTGLLHDDIGPAATGQSYYYSVRAANACGQETP